VVVRCGCGGSCRGRRLRHSGGRFHHLCLRLLLRFLRRHIGCLLRCHVGCELLRLVCCRGSSGFAESVRGLLLSCQFRRHLLRHRRQLRVSQQRGRLRRCLSRPFSFSAAVSCAAVCCFAASCCAAICCATACCVATVFAAANNISCCVAWSSRKVVAFPTSPPAASSAPSARETCTCVTSMICWSDRGTD